jgi:hypothetical protein
MRQKVARALLWFGVIWWGVWFGGQLFNALMVVPYFSSHPPAMLEEWGRARNTNNGDFFVLFNALWIFWPQSSPSFSCAAGRDAGRWRPPHSR